MALKALIIDDSGMTRKLIMKLLAAANLAEFEFFEAGDGHEALQLFKQHAPDIAFVDWNMPKMSGIDFVRLAKAEQLKPTPAFIMVTSESTTSKIEQALDKVGANAYIVKPIDTEVLIKRLKPILERLKARQTGPGAVAAKPSSGGFFSKLLG